MTTFTASVVESAALAWMEASGWHVVHGSDIVPPCLPACCASMSWNGFCRSASYEIQSRKHHCCSIRLKGYDYSQPGHTLTPSSRTKEVMTGSASDPPDWQPHIPNKPRREALANCFRDAQDTFRVVIVRDM